MATKCDNGIWQTNIHCFESKYDLWFSGNAFTHVFVYSAYIVITNKPLGSLVIIRLKMRNVFRLQTKGILVIREYCFKQTCENLMTTDQKSDDQKARWTQKNVGTRFYLVIVRKHTKVKHFAFVASLSFLLCVIV